MRRDEFVFEDRAYIEKFLNSIEFGVLAIPDELRAYAVPISFCFHQIEAMSLICKALSGLKN